MDRRASGRNSLHREASGSRLEWEVVPCGATEQVPEVEEVEVKLERCAEPSVPSEFCRKLEIMEGFWIWE